MRYLMSLAAIAVLALGVALPAAAGHGSDVEGRWLNRDLNDGSRQIMTVEEGTDGFFDVYYVDTRATGACDPAARFEAESTSATLDGTTFTAPLTNPECSGRSTPDIPDPFIAVFELQEDGTMTSDDGTWYRVGR